MHVFVAPMLSCCRERDKVAQRRGNEKAARGDTECQVTRVAGSNTEQCCSAIFCLFFVIVFLLVGCFWLSLLFRPSRCCRNQRRGDGESEPRYRCSGPGAARHFGMCPTASDVKTCRWLNADEQICAKLITFLCFTQEKTLDKTQNISLWCHLANNKQIFIFYTVFKHKTHSPHTKLHNEQVKRWLLLMHYSHNRILWKLGS